MQSKTSFFNAAVFRKTVSRFWPIWGGYLTIGLLALPFILLSNSYSYQQHPDRLAEYVLNVSHFGGLAMSAVFALFMAMAVWSFLFSTRATHGMACLPLCRENVFVSVTLGGIVPLLAANVVVYALAALAAAGIGVPDFGAVAQGFAIASLQMIFFFGFASFCAFLTGHILALPAVYAVLNFVFVGMETLVRFLLSMFVYGLHSNIEAMSLRWLSPVVAILMDCGCNSSGEWQGDVYILTEPVHFIGWGALLAYALAGLVFLALALVLFRRRRMEAAGDVVAIGILKPIFRWCMAIGSAVCLGCLLFTLFVETPTRYNDISQMTGLLLLIGFMFFGAFVGWFAGEMLLKKSFRVFRGKWGGLGICWLLIAVLMLACEFDLFGYERYVPKSDKVESVQIMAQYGDTAVLCERENLDAVRALHQRIVSEKDSNEAMGEAQSRGECYNSIQLMLSYTLTDGRTAEREYEIFYNPDGGPDYGTAGDAQALMNCPEAIRSRKETDVPVRPDTVAYASVTMPMPAAECAAAAGYDSAEEYVLREIQNIPRNIIPAMNEADRRAALIEAVNYSAYSYRLNDSFADYYADAAYAYDDSDVPYDIMREKYPAAFEEEQWTPETGCPLENVMFDYEFTLTPVEATELYTDCIVPDFEDGTLGRVWYITDEEYDNTVTCGSIRIQLLRSASEPVTGGYTTFYTVPTVDSVRTNAYLAERGIVLHTEAELDG